MNLSQYRKEKNNGNGSKVYHTIVFEPDSEYGKALNAIRAIGVFGDGLTKMIGDLLIQVAKENGIRY